MPIRPTRPATALKKPVSKRIVGATAGIAVVAIALVGVLFYGTGGLPTSLGAGSSSSDSNGMANATTSGTTSSSTASMSGAAIQTGTVSGVEDVYVSVVETTPQTSDDVNTGMTQAAVNDLISKMDAYWSAQSNGEVTIELAGFETRSLGESTCDPNAALSSEESSAFGGMFANDAWKGTHKHLLVLSAESCNADSFATVGGVGGEIFSGNGIDASEGYEYLLHEFGHNLGFEHADASICTNTGSYDGTSADFGFTSTVCPTREYDDYFDIMGYTVKNATPNLSSPQRIMAGWLSNYDTLTNSKASYSETVSALGSSGGTQALKIVDPTSGDIYYVEYRTATGYDATSAEFNYGQQCDAAVDGYTTCELGSSTSTGDVRILRVLPFASSNANGTTVMADSLTAGSTDATKRKTHLDAGNSFTSVDGGFSLKVLATSPSDGASIQVTFPSAAAAQQTTPTPAPTSSAPTSSAPTTSAPTNTAPTVTRTASTISERVSRTTVRQGSRVSVRVTVHLAGTTRPTGTVAVSVDGAPARGYALRAIRRGVLTVVTGRLAGVGSHTISVTYSGPGNALATASASITTR